jgi:class 3 adenylate cyclase
VSIHDFIRERRIDFPGRGRLIARARIVEDTMAMHAVTLEEAIQIAEGFLRKMDEDVAAHGGRPVFVNFDSIASW